MRVYGMYEVLEDATRCFWAVREPPHYVHEYQCRRKRGHGPDGLFCKQHARMWEEAQRVVED